MNQLLKPMIVAIAALSVIACQPKSADQSEAALDTDNQKFSYAVGKDVANSLARIKDELDVDALARGIRDGFSGAPAAVTEEEINTARQAVIARRQAEEQKQRETAGAANIEAGKAFLAKNADQEGIVTTDSGLQYKVLTAGEGNSPTATDTVKVHYTGTLIDGTKFDSSVDRGEPATFPVNAVIPGWTEALQLMKPGGKYQLFIPSDLGYGDRGAGQVIGPNATLLFDVELLEIMKPEKK